MVKKCDKDEDEVVKLEREIKELKSIIKSLDRQLKKQDKKYKPEHSSEQLVAQEYEDKTLCRKCGKGRLKSTNLGPRTLVVCPICGERQTIKNEKIT